MIRMSDVLHWVSITGSRYYPADANIWPALDEKEKSAAIESGRAFVESNVARIPLDWGVVSGGAKGPDTWAEEAALRRGLEVAIYVPEWDKYGSGAGFRRNTLIAHHADSCLIFWDGLSRGTNDFIRKVFRLRKEIWLIGPSGSPWAIWDKPFWDAHPEENVRMDIPRGK